MPIIDKEKLIREGFKSFDLSGEQEKAVSKLLDGYIVFLIASKVPLSLSKAEVKAYVDIIKTAVSNCLNLMEVARGPHS